MENWMTAANTSDGIVKLCTTDARPASFAVCHRFDPEAKDRDRLGLSGRTKRSGQSPNRGLRAFESFVLALHEDPLFGPQAQRLHGRQTVVTPDTSCGGRGNRFPGQRLTEMLFLPFMISRQRCFRSNDGESPQSRPFAQLVRLGPRPRMLRVIGQR